MFLHTPRAAFVSHHRVMLSPSFAAALAAVVLDGMPAPCHQYDVTTNFKWSLASTGVSTHFKGGTLLCHLANTTATQDLQASPKGRAAQTRHCGGSKDEAAGRTHLLHLHNQGGAFTKAVLTSMPTKAVLTSSKTPKASYQPRPPSLWEQRA